MKIKSFLAPVFFLISSFAVGQDRDGKNYFIPQLFPNGPNTAALAKYGGYPVNYSTGVPDISIPLYEIKSGNLTVPVTLNYHASGIKITDVASWAGLGWSVSAGGEITRKVMGKPDESGVGYLSGGFLSSIQINADTEDGVNYLADILTGMRDSEPDIFSYNFPGKSGKFFFNRLDNYKPALIPFSPISVNKTKSGGQLTFHILDEHGNAFNFNSSEITHPLYGTTESTVSAWKLDNMIAADKRDTILFSYHNQGSETAADEMETWVVEDIVNKINSDCPYTSNLNVARFSTLTGSSITEKVLNEIKFKNGKVVFQLSTVNREDIQNSKCLSNIKVYQYDYGNRQYQLLKAIHFYQSYFIKDNDLLSQRLRLDSLDITDKEGNIVQRYKFNYNALNLPRSISKARDYWGYYNGKLNSTSLIPRQQIDMVYGTGPSETAIIGSGVENNREPDSMFMQACILKRIYYPTGGYTDFEYGTNRYLDGSVVKLAGGLRIKSIKSYDGINSVPIVKTYKYGINENGYGRANFHLTNYYFKTQQTYRYYSFFSSSSLGVSGTKRVRTFVSDPTADIEAWDGVPVIYSSVTEYAGNGNNNTGKTIFEFTDHQDLIDAASFVKPVINSYFYQRGQLLSKSVYKNDNGIYTLIHKEDNTYTAFPSKTYIAVGLIVNKRMVNEGVIGGDRLFPNDGASWAYSDYSIQSDDNYLTSTVSTDFDQNDTSKYVISTINYKYDNIIHQQPNRIISTDSRGKQRITVNKYPADYQSSAGNPTGNAVLDTMLAYNMQASVVEKWDSLRTASSSVVLDGQLNLYKALPYHGIGIDTIKKLEILHPVIDFQPSGILAGKIKADSRYSPLISFDRYGYNDGTNNKNNLLQYTPRNAGPVSIIWDYQYAMPVAEIKNSTTNDAAYTSFEGDGKGSWTFSGNTITDNTAPTGVRVYSLDGGSVFISGLSANKEHTISYWLKNGTANITGSLVTTGASRNGWTYYEHKLPAGSTSINVTGTGYIDELRLYPQGAEMVTYTYEPLVGMRSQTDPKGETTYYEYDHVQRLMNIKDQNDNIIKSFQYRYKTSGGTVSGVADTVPLASVNLVNYTSVSGYQARFYNDSLSQIYDFPVSGGTIVNIPPGTYTVIINPAGDFNNQTFSCNGNTIIGQAATFNNVILSADAGSLQITINY